MQESFFQPEELDVSRYDTEPLPFESVTDAAQALTWKDFDQDESGENVFMYRSVGKTNNDEVVDTGHKSHASRNNETREQIFERYKTKDIKEISKIATFHFQGQSPVLHVSRNKDFSKNLLLQDPGVLITYKIPKAWLIQKENRPIIGNIGEFELDFFYEIPKEFISDLEQIGNLDVRYIDTNAPIDTPEPEILSGDDLPAPPPPDLKSEMP